MGEINSFWGKYRFLSNFYPSPIEIGGITYKTVEHFFQASKCENIYEKETIINSGNPSIAKKLGRRVLIISNWEDVKIDVMEQALREKFSSGSELASKLIDTKDSELIEGNKWGDVFWGVCNKKGENHLGRLLMKIRKELIN